MTSAETLSVVEEADAIVKQLLTQLPPDPYPTYARLREIAPIHRASFGDFWTLSRYADIEAAVKDKRFVRDYEDMRRRTGQPADYSRPFTQNQRRWFAFHNPPDYLPKRALYNTAFNRNYVDSLRPMIARFAGELLDAAERDGGRIEIVDGLGFELTVRVISSTLGVPEGEDTRLLVDFARDVAPTFNPLSTDEVMAAADEATVNLEGYLTELVAAKRRRPGHDLLSRLIAADEQGLLSEEELRANAALVFMAGLETTTHFIGNSVYSLMRNRDQWELFVTDPEGLAKDAVEELLRYDSSVQADLPLRLAREDIEIGGVTIPAGDCVVPFLGSANRDPQRYTEPDRLDLTRTDIRTLAFGGGVHICLGQHLARIETQEALVLLAKRFPNMRIVGPEPTWTPGVTNRSLERLDVSLA